MEYPGVVKRAYMKILNRLPDENGLAAYSTIKSRIKLEKILKNSKEYKMLTEYDSKQFDQFICKVASLLQSKLICASADVHKCAVIVEGREQKCFQTIVKLTMHLLGSEWGLIVVCTERNVKYCKYLQDIDNVIFKYVENMEDVEDYNNLLLSSNFWEHSLEGTEQVLIFQTDAFVCQPGIEKFIGVDYIGARSLCNQVMNGGFSLRRRQAMVDILSKFKPKLFENEDVFFSRLVQSPSYEAQDAFSVEQRDCKILPFGVHKLWFYCPEAASWVFDRVLENLST